MGWLPTNLGTRPRLALEMRPEGVVAARAEEGGSAALAAVSIAEFQRHTAMWDSGDRGAIVASVKKTLEAVTLKERIATLVLPDTAVRVLLLDFDELPAKSTEAMPVVRFRLKKLLPFDVDDAVVSYQVMSSSRSGVKVLAVAVPKDVLAEYEGVVREAGFEPGAVLPSTLAACAGMADSETATLLVNAGEGSVTTAIVRGGELLLHRTIDLAASGVNEMAAESVMVETRTRLEDEGWPASRDLVATADEGHVTAQAVLRARMIAEQIRTDADREASAGLIPGQLPPQSAEQVTAAREVTQAVSVAAAYFEDTLQQAPGVVLCAGTLSAGRLAAMLRDAGFGEEEVRVREMVEPAMLSGQAVTAPVPRGWMAGVRGALRS